MSDPVSRKNDEEVLSSVRRAVREERPDEEFDVTSSARGRLVLTPQHRISDDPEDVLRLEPQHARAAQRKDRVAEDPETQETPARNTPAADAPAVLTPAGTASVPGASPRAPLKPDTASDVFALSAKIAAFETAIGRIPDQWEPDGAGTDAYAGTVLPAMTWPDAEETRDTVQQEADAPAARPQEPDGSVSLAHAGPGIDEDVLREMVAEIVRSELKGPLGERITRNVRTLVRREIQNALAAHSLKQP